MRIKSFLFLFFFLILLTTPVLAILQSSGMKIFAVTEDHKGIAADLLVSTIPGTGKVAFFTSNSLVGKDTQTTGNIALQIALKKTNSMQLNNDLLFDIRANASEVDGPSAGAAMTLVVYSMLAEKPLQQGVAVTGTINSDGSIGMVGGVGPKSQAASKSGIKLLMIPAGEAITEVEVNGKLETINLLEYGPKNLGIKIVEVSTIDQAIEFAYANIEEIKVDSNGTNIRVFIPKPITYNKMLAPMKKISNGYIDEARAVIDEAKEALEHSTVSDELRGRLYSDHSATKRNSEMAQRFFDQNYLYSAANYAFNARVTAGVIKEIAKNPSILSSDNTILEAKVNDLKKEIALVKQKCNYISVNEFEWMIAAQQRIAYSENALNKIMDKMIVQVNNTGKEQSASQNQSAEEALGISKVFDYVSASAWLEVSRDFLNEAEKSTNKKIPAYSKEFLSMLKTKLNSVKENLTDLNVSQTAREEAQRRYDSAMISFDNNYYLAAFYDAYFADSFISAEKKRKNYSIDELFSAVQAGIKENSGSNSIWGSLFLDHAKLYYENAVFNKKLGRTDEITQSLETSYDLIYLSKELSIAKKIIQEQGISSSVETYTDREPIIGITYTKEQNISQYLIVLTLVLSIILIALIMLLGLASRASHSEKLSYDSRKAKLLLVLRNLNKALSQNKISDAEYFFMKKKYEDELNTNTSFKEEHEKLNLTLGDIRSRKRALEKGLLDLSRHYAEGLIIPEDYEHSLKKIRSEISELNSEENKYVHELHGSRTQQTPALKPLRRKRFISRTIKGTRELAVDEEKQQKREKTKRKAVISKYSSKE